MILIKKINKNLIAYVFPFPLSSPSYVSSPHPLPRRHTPSQTYGLFFLDYYYYTQKCVNIQTQPV